MKPCQTLNQEKQSNPIPKDRNPSGCVKNKEERERLNKKFWTRKLKVQKKVTSNEPADSIQNKYSTLLVWDTANRFQKWTWRHNIAGNILKLSKMQQHFFSRISGTSSYQNKIYRMFLQEPWSAQNRDQAFTDDLFCNPFFSQALRFFFHQSTSIKSSNF